MNATHRVLLLCYGNPAREDDGLGPALAERIEGLSLEGVKVSSDYQLCVEDAAEIAESDLVVFADAAMAGPEPFTFERTAPRPFGGFMSHTIAPEPLLALAGEAFGRCPEAYLLAIRGYEFEMFREGLTARAEANLEEAVEFLARMLRSPEESPQARAAEAPHAPAGSGGDEGFRRQK